MPVLKIIRNIRWLWEIVKSGDFRRGDFALKNLKIVGLLFAELSVNMYRESHEKR
jgi:hypothetical protein